MKAARVWARCETGWTPWRTHSGPSHFRTFIALADEGESAGMPARDILPTVESLIATVQNPAKAFPSRKKAVSILGKIRDSLLKVNELDGCACFEVDA